MNENRQIVTSLIYKFIERIGYQGISFVIQIILARMLDPTDYGVLTMLTVFINISQVFVQSGLNTALIQKQNVDELDYSSVFYVSLGIAILLYGILYVCAPWIADFYRMEELESVLRVLALILLPGALNSIQNAKIAREMKFKKLMYSSMGAAVISGIVGIIFAAADFGTWALVAQQIVNQISICIILLGVLKWRPHLLFSLERVKVLFSFGWKLLCSGLIDTIYNNLQSLVIGKKYNSETLGYYNRGKQFPQLIVENINGSIQSVMLPALSKRQEEKKKMKALMRRSIITSSYVLFPMMVGLAVVAKPLVSLILTDKWLPCVPYLWINCFVYAFMPIHTANLQALNAQGRSDQYLKLEIIKKSYGLLILCITVWLFHSPMAIAMGNACTTVISCFVNAFPNKKLLHYSYFEQMKDILPSAVVAILMGIIIWPISWLPLPQVALVFLQIVCGIVIYILLSVIFKLDAILYIWDKLKKIIAKLK